VEQPFFSNKTKNSFGGISGRERKQGGIGTGGKKMVVQGRYCLKGTKTEASKKKKGIEDQRVLAQTASYYEKSFSGGGKRGAQREEEFQKRPRKKREHRRAIMQQRSPRKKKRKEFTRVGGWENVDR